MPHAPTRSRVARPRTSAASRALLSTSSFCLLIVGCASTSGVESSEPAASSVEAHQGTSVQDSTTRGTHPDSAAQKGIDEIANTEAVDDPGFSPIGDAYCTWGVARMVVEYMRANGDRWPRSWADLQPYLADERMVGWTLDTHAKRVWIDFDADPDELYRLANAEDLEPGVIPFDVIGARSMFALQWGEGPNGILLRYLQRDRGVPAKR